ncbi:S8 family serine peptidase [Roseateles oligotrophus]|uniref:S8 family serine peptidase n=1 Tax=Roseateles oligotrophus TaxID=1769250 RepID=A0ABT2YKG4_9BURK|nr:S8 family serine peptidase [Roseateles oligotrophus]MCV2370554.1 S8 family serine peptidase [Roseateles oligotrophus]
MKLRPISLAAVALLAGLAASAQAQEARRAYIVQLQAQPVASAPQLAPAQTRSATTARINFESAAVQDYVQYLGEQQNLVASTVANAEVFARYTTVLNGFAALLTDAEVATLKNNAGVLSVQPDEMRQLLTISTSTFLGLDKAGGLWSQLSGRSNAGEGMVVGIIDGGIWPENPAFADRVDANGVPSFNPADAQNYGPAPATFSGTCDTAGNIKCNNKLVGARYFSAGMHANYPTFHWTEFDNSARDSIGGSVGHGGHGDHTASTVAGNWGATAVVNGVPMGVATGMAPRARVSSYKVCWTFPLATEPTGGKNSCTSSDIVSAIDQAVKDGVNVINFSISGGTSVNDSAEQAFLRATNAGVFVAASAGNSGPANEVAHISPWLTTVAASTHDRAFKGTVTLGNGAAYTGATLSLNDLTATDMLLAEAAGVGGGNANLCYSAAAPAGQVLLDPAKVAGKVVVCTRGGNARVDKSLAVQNAGGVGMVLVDNGSGLVADAHSIPSVHISAADGALVKTYAAAATPTAAITKFFIGTTPAPKMAGFSSRGPNRFDGNVLKPDLTAPGVDVVASVTPGATEAEKLAIESGAAAGLPAWASYQGTSMSSPHVAGLATLLKQRNPSWTPAMIKSALMTTTYNTLDDGLTGMQNGMTPWSQGAGHVDPNKAADPGLVFDLGAADYTKYQCKVGSLSGAACVGGALDETYNLNLPSMTVGNVLGTVPVTMTRTVTNVGAASATYTASASLPGFTTVVTPSTLTLAPGAKATFTVKITATTAVDNEWNYGSVTWSDGAGHVVKSPLTAKVGKAIVAPAELTSDRVSGSKLFNVKTGFAGRMTAIKGGLKAASLGESVTLAPNDAANALNVCKAGVDTANVKVHQVTIAAGTVVARFALRNQDTSHGAADDFDLVMVNAAGVKVGDSGNGGSNEAMQITSPEAGNYKVCVHAYAGPEASMSYQLSSWLVTSADMGGNFKVALPGKVVSGGNAVVGMSWSGLANSERYLGAAQFLDASGKVQATTALRVETGAAPLAQSDKAVKLSK